MEPDRITPDIRRKKTFGDRVRGVVKAFTTRYAAAQHLYPWTAETDFLCFQRWVDWRLRLCVPLPPKPPVHEERAARLPLLRPRRPYARLPRAPPRLPARPRDVSRRYNPTNPPRRRRRRKPHRRAHAIPRYHPLPHSSHSPSNKPQSPHASSSAASSPSSRYPASTSKARNTSSAPASSPSSAPPSPSFPSPRAR